MKSGRYSWIDDMYLRRMADQGRTAAEIAKDRDRSQKSIRARAQYIGVEIVSEASRLWTIDRTEYLRQHWGRDSASKIASELGCTRNAVIGKAHRLKLTSGQLRGTEGHTIEVPIMEKPVVKRTVSRKFATRCETRECSSTAQPGNRYRLCAECNHKRILESENRENKGKELSVGAPIRRTA